VSDGDFEARGPVTQINHLGFLIRDAVRLYPDRPVLLQDDVVISYAQLDERADRVAGWLAVRGVAHGRRVALLWQNDVRYVEALLGIMRAGAVAVPLNTRQNDETLAYVLADADCAGILAGPSEQDRAVALAASSGRGDGFVAGPDDLQAAAPLADPPPHHPDAVCMQPYTSGSTGRPKGVPLTHRGQLWCADAVRKCYLFDETERALLAAPLFHKNAAMTLKSVLLAGGACVVLPGFDPVGMLRAIDRYKITYLSGVPAMYRMLLSQAEELQRCDVSSVRFASAGSAPVTIDLLEDFGREFGAPIGEGYGLTEGGPDVLLAPRWGINKLGSLGLPLPGCEVQLRAQDGRTEVGTGEVGELWVRNPGVTPGYHGLPEVTAERIRDGWLATRDLMSKDSDGYYYFVGRTDDLINVAGENVYPKEVEQLLLRHPAVRDVAVVAGVHPVKGTVPVAFVVATSPGAVTTQELTTFFHSVGPHYAYPRVIEFVTELPLAGTGKIDRNGLQSRARALVEA
jgi:acyl-CoA synthetase (AMP-forming)/AMP-acid ligase II